VFSDERDERNFSPMLLRFLDAESNSIQSLWST